MSNYDISHKYTQSPEVILSYQVLMNCTIGFQSKFNKQ